jgi:hypothetical protein
MHFISCHDAETSEPSSFGELAPELANSLLSARAGGGIEQPLGEILTVSVHERSFIRSGTLVCLVQGLVNVVSLPS